MVPNKRPEPAPQNKNASLGEALMSDSVVGDRGFEPRTSTV